MLPRNIHENVLSIHVAEADTEEDVELLIVNRNTSTKLSKSDVLKVLKGVTGVQPISRQALLFSHN